METQIYLYPEEIWEYFMLNIADCCEEVVASNFLCDIEISAQRVGSYLQFTINSDSFDIYETNLASNEKECEKMADDIYEEYLGKDWLQQAIYGEDAYEYEEIDDLDDIFENDRAERIVEIYDAFYDLLNVLLDDSPIDGMIDELSEVVGKWLYKHNISIYHPMKLEDNKGNSEWVDFPYPEIT